MRCSRADDGDGRRLSSGATKAGEGWTARRRCSRSGSRPAWRSAGSSPIPLSTPRSNARFGALVERAAAGELAALGGVGAWLPGPVPAARPVPAQHLAGYAARLLLRRHGARGGPAALAAGHDRDLTPAQRHFLYLPFEHSENLADQERCVALMHDLGDAEMLDYAQRHRDVIARFGRFPHRNAILGRQSSAGRDRVPATAGLVVLSTDCGAVALAGRSG